MNLTDNARTILAKRYLRLHADGAVETPDDMFRRVAHNISQAERAYDNNEAVPRNGKRSFTGSWPDSSSYRTRRR